MFCQQESDNLYTNFRITCPKTSKGNEKGFNLCAIEVFGELHLFEITQQKPPNFSILEQNDRKFYGKTNSTIVCKIEDEKTWITTRTDKKIENGRQKLMFRILDDENSDYKKQTKLVGASVAIGGLIIHLEVFL